MTKEKLYNEVKSTLENLPDAFFDGAYVFRNRKEYSIAAGLHTDTLSPAIWMELDMAELPENIEEYQVHVLDKEECNRTILANSSIKIEEVWPQDASHAVLVRILVNEEE